jgi:hypothetical protein
VLLAEEELAVEVRVLNVVGVGEGDLAPFPSPTIAKFLSSSQPIAPAPIINEVEFLIS